jgi:hypothetical protein
VTADLLLLVLLLVGVPTAVITTVIVVSLAAARRRQQSPPVGFGLVDGTGRQALVAAWHAHARLAVLEGRVADLEQQASIVRQQGGAA